MSLNIRDRSCDIVNLNVGGTRFSTSRNTLTWITDSFFSSMLSGRISTQKDGSGAIFIDRDPDLFRIVLNYLRTKEIDTIRFQQKALLHEAEFYGLTPLVRKLQLCQDLKSPACGGILFHGLITPPTLPYPLMDERRHSNTSSMEELVPEDIRQMTPIERHFYFQRARKNKKSHLLLSPSVSESGSTASLTANPRSDGTEDLLLNSRQQSPAANPSLSPCRVLMLKGHFNWLAVAYPSFVCLFRQKDQTGWNLHWTSPHLDSPVDRVALNVKMPGQSQDGHTRMVAVSLGTNIRLWAISDDGRTREIGKFDLTASLQSLFFIGSQLVALSPEGKVGVWHAMTQNWQVQDVVPICSHDTAGSFLLLGCENGSIYYIDMQKFPLRMKDNDLLITELYRDPAEEMVTALSVYLTPRTSTSGNWIEIAYGTNAGKVRVIVQHPETVGQGPQLFQTFTVHTSPILNVMLSEKHLISVCSEYNHVRAWTVTRFRGMISTQPGSMPLASFKVVSLEQAQLNCHYLIGNDIGPYGDKDDQQVFIQKVVPETDTVFVRLASSGKRICKIQSVDESEISAFCVHECEGSNRMGSRPRRYLFTGHSDGSIQIWDLSTAIQQSTQTSEDEVCDGGPTEDELLEQLDFCDLTNSCSNTPSLSPSVSLLNSLFPGRNVPSSVLLSTPERSRRDAAGEVKKNTSKLSVS